MCSQINGRTLTQPTFSHDHIKVVVSDNTVRIDSSSSIQLYLSSTNELTMSVSENVADMVCGACGTLRPTDTTIQELKEMLVLSLHGQSTSLASLNIVQWAIPDFPQWNFTLV